MSSAEQKIVQYLNEAHASEIALVSALRSQISMAPDGSYREGLETHLDETRDHAERIQMRLDELGDRATPLQSVIGFTEAMIAQALALGKAPFDLIRGSSDEEKALKNAKDACAAEALEIATYTALEELAGRVGDTQTAKLAVAIRSDEERMLQRLVGEIPRLTDAVIGEDVGRSPSSGRARPKAARRASGATQTPRKTRTRGADGARQPRTSSAVAETRSDEPWPGYDELTSREIEAILIEGDDQLARKVVAYEREHKGRPDVMQRALIPAPYLNT
jgi:ferritin-like metal-binding protein YciE